MELGPVGVVAGLILLVQTVIAAYFASRSKHYAAAYRWRRHMEPIHLDLLEWAWQVQMQAAKNGTREHLPPLPPSVQSSWDGEPDWVRRRHDRRSR